MILVLTAIALLTSASAAGAEPITIALASAIGVTLTAGAISTALVTTALTVAASYGLSLVATALRSKTDPQSPDTTVQSASGSDLNTKYGGSVPRSAMFGLGATAGHLVYANVYGPNNTGLQAVFVLGDGHHDSITRMWYNGKLVTFSSTPTHGTQVHLNEFVDASGAQQVKITFYDGRFAQSADPELVAHANPTGRWTTDHKGVGVCYIVVYQGYSEELQTTNMPSLLVEMKGLKLYDPRLDTTAGGSGPHRWADPSTYEWSDNPALIEYNYRRGVYIDDQLILGMGVSASDLILPMYMSAANVCDEAVALLEGGTEKRYRCGFTASSDKAHSEIITTVRDAMAGYSLERVGQFAPIPGVNQITLFTFTDDDLEVGKQFSFSKYKTRSAIATAIYGSFSDPEQLWGAVPFPARIDPADDALMGERLSRTVDLTQVFSHSQAQRIAEIERRRSMLQVNGVCTLPAQYFGVQPGDWGTYDSARYGTFDIVVKGVSLNQDHSITITWDAIESHVYSWTTAGEEARPAIPTGGEAGTRINLVTGFAAVGVDIPGDGGVIHPGFQVDWDPILDPTITAVIVEYRVAATAGDWGDILFTVPSQGAGQISAGIQGNTVYELRAALLVSPYRPTGVTASVSALSGSHVVSNALIAQSVAGTVTGVIDQLFTSFSERMSTNEQRLANALAEAQALQATIRGETFTQIAEQRETDIQELNGVTASVETARSEQLSDRASLARYQVSISSRIEEASAMASLVLTTYASLNGSFASFVLSATARFEGNEASISTNATAITDANTAFSSYQTTVDVRFDANELSVTTLSGVVADIDGALLATYQITLDVNGYVSGLKFYNDGTTADVIFVVDNFQIASPGVTGGDPVPIFQVGNVNGVPKVGIRGDLLVDGTILSRHLVADIINASTLIADNVIIRGHMVADTATKMVATGGSSDSFSWNQVEAVAAFVSLSAVGGTVFIEGNVAVRQLGLATSVPDVSAGDVLLRLYVDSTLVRTVYLSARAYALTSAGGANVRLDMAGSWNISYVHTPSVGTHDYEIRVISVNNNGWGPTFFDVALAAFEARR